MKSLGFPRMYKEKNEKRAFLPDFFAGLSDTAHEIFLEKGYGAKMGFDEKDYTESNPQIKFVSKEECYSKDIVTVLRAPGDDELELMSEGTVLVSMLHYPTREKRNKKLQKMGIIGVSMDSIRDDFMNRIVFNANGTSSNGLEAAFHELEKVREDFYTPTREPIRVSIIGMGQVGLNAARAASKYANQDINHRMKSVNAPGVIITMLPRNITSDKIQMMSILRDTDILVDASTRDNPYEYIVTNDMLASLKPDCIIVDLTADPYIVDEDMIQVKAIEGIPTGNLDKYIIYKDEKEYYDIPDKINKLHKRTVISCDAWPGVKPRECMKLYGIQLLPIITKLIEKSVDEMKLDSPYYFERAIYKSTFEYFYSHEHKQ